MRPFVKFAALAAMTALAALPAAGCGGTVSYSSPPLEHYEPLIRSFFAPRGGRENYPE